MYTYHSILTWCPGPKPNHKPDVLGSKLQKLVRQLDKTQNWYSFSPTTPPPKVIMSCSWYFKYLHTIVLGWPRNKLVEVASQAHRPAPSVVNLMATWVRASISSCTPRVLDNVCGLHSWSTVVSAAPENMKYEKQSLLSSLVFSDASSSSVDCWCFHWQAVQVSLQIFWGEGFHWNIVRVNWSTNQMKRID